MSPEQIRCKECGELKPPAEFEGDSERCRSAQLPGGGGSIENRDANSYTRAVTFPSPTLKTGKRRRRRTLKDRARERRRKRPSSRDRGYGHHHRKLRERLAPLVASGMAICARCGQRIAPGDPWDLGHVDGDRSKYAGPEHQRCNRATSSRRRHSRDW